jgi:hypothetical protein
MKKATRRGGVKSEIRLPPASHLSPSLAGNLIQKYGEAAHFHHEMTICYSREFVGRVDSVDLPSRLFMISFA